MASLDIVTRYNMLRINDRSFHTISHNMWFRGNVAASHPASPSSIPGQMNFLVEVFPEIFLNFKTSPDNIGHRDHHK